MATAEYKATMDASGGVRAGSSNLFGKTSTDATSADTAVGTVVTDHTTAFTDYDTFAAAVIAITRDTYSGTTKQFTFGGATGLTHAQWATVGALLNTAATDFKTAQTDTNTAKTATALVVTDAAAVDSGADVSVRIGSLTNVGTRTKFAAALDAIRLVVLGSNIMTA